MRNANLEQVILSPKLVHPRQEVNLHLFIGLVDFIRLEIIKYTRVAKSLCNAMCRYMFGDVANITAVSAS